MNTSVDVLVVGGGIHGCALALNLARRRLRVMIIEKDYSGRHASGVNSGGVRLLGRDPRELPLALEAQRLWRDIESLVGDDCGLRTVGNLRIAEDPQGLAALERRVAEIDRLGLDYRERLIDGPLLWARLPAASRHCIAAIVDDNGAHAQPYRATRAFRHAAVDAGVEVVEGVRVTQAHRDANLWRIETSSGRTYRAGIVVNCAGAWGARIAAMLGEEFALAPNGSMQMVTERLPPLFEPIVASASRPLSMKQFANGTVVIGGGQRASIDLDSGRSDIDVRGLAIAAKAAAEIFPALRGAKLVRAWSGIEGFTADKLPVIGPGESPGVFHVFGFSGHGFQLAPAVARVVADHLIDGESDISLEPFAPARLACVGTSSYLTH